MSAADLLDIARAGVFGLFAILALAGCVVTLLTLWAVRRTLGAPPESVPAGAERPAISILKPLHGLEPGLAENLESFYRQDYPGPFEVVFGVSRPADPALAVAREVAARHPARQTRFIVDERRHGTNGKVSNLVNMTAAGVAPVVVLADSDMRVEPFWLDEVVDALQAEGVGLVTCLYRGAALPRLSSRLTAAGIDFHFLPNVLFGLMLGLAKPCFGSTIALRRDTLAAIGGFQAFRDILADDNAMGQAVRARGLRVAVPPGLVLDHVCAATDMRAMVRQDLRWSRTIKAVDPAGFAGSVVTNPLPLAGIAWLFDGFGVVGAALVVAALACRFALQLSVRQLAGATSPLWLGPLRDLVSFAVFLASFRPGSLHWRDQAFAVDSQGAMTPPGQTGS